MEMIKYAREDGRPVEYVLEGYQLQVGEPQYFGLDASEVYGMLAYEVTEMRDGYRVTNVDRCLMIWDPALLRGAVVHGADPTWSDADSPADLATRVLISGELLA